ncbi:MAG: hypothetical protein V1875_01520 [Candidatus Altiarchaeota archaeon]
MDKLFIFFAAVIVAFAAYVVFAEGPETANLPQTASATTTSTTLPEPTTTTASLQADNTLPEPTSTSTTSSTLPESPDSSTLRVHLLEKCRETVNGKMNAILVDTPDDIPAASWTERPVDSFGLICDQTGGIRPDEALRAGGVPIGPGSDVSGRYRLMVKCGRTGTVYDLKDCENLTVRLDLLESEPEVAEATTSTIYHNPYLDRFVGKGYRKADLKVSWLCPSCVPAVNSLVIGEPGVKSRSLGYRNPNSYVIYDPGIVSLERVLELTGAGGDVVLLNDTEL